MRQASDTFGSFTHGNEGGLVRTGEYLRNVLTPRVSTLTVLPVAEHKSIVTLSTQRSILGVAALEKKQKSVVLYAEDSGAIASLRKNMHEIEKGSLCPEDKTIRAEKIYLAAVGYGLMGEKRNISDELRQAITEAKSVGEPLLSTNFSQQLHHVKLNT